MGYYGGCGPNLGFRRYISRKERTEWLKDYQGQLENEIQAVKERIQELEAASDEE